MRVKLGDLIEEYSERNSDNKYKPVAVGKYGIRTRESIYSKELAKDYSKNKLIHKGTLTVGMGSSQIDIGILRDDETYSVSPAYHTYKIKISNYDYLDYLLAANNNRMFSIYANRGSRQGKTLDLKRWLTDELDIHDEKDQKTIVQSLNAIKQLIRQKETELAKLDNLIKARFVEMFGDGFETTELRNICKTTSGGTPSTKNPDYYNGTIPWVTTTALGPNHIDDTKAKAYISEEAVANSATKIIPSGSILFGIRVGVGKTSINDVDICTNQDIVAIMDVNETKFSKLFIKHVLDANRAHYDSLKKRCYDTRNHKRRS